jgi:CDP-archaeol synthase
VELQSAARTLLANFFSILLNETHRVHWRFHLEPIYLKLLFLIVVANLAPIIGQRLLRNRCASPLDCGLRFLDGRPLLGPSKTWRGYMFSIPITSACAWVEGLDMTTGLVFSLAVLLGDSVTSFIKRRLGMVSGGRAPGLDQVLESLLPLLMVQHRFDLALSGILGVVMAFIILNLIFWRYYARPHYS